MDRPTNHEPSASTTRLQDQAIHSADRQIVETPLELHNRGLDLNSKRLDLNVIQILLNAELFEFYRRQHALDDEQFKLSSEQLELTARTNVRIVMGVISLASARTSAIPVVDAQQLGLAEDLHAVVLGPRLCFMLIKICGMEVNQLAGPIISSVFSEVTGED
ncbi:hypothetical protein LPJ71_006201, partial [Coemansia sp. S17]